MKSQSRLSILLLILVALLLASCGSPREPAIETEQPQPETAVVEAAPTAIHTQPAADQPNDAPAADPDKCAAPDPSLAFPEAGYEALPDVIQGFLNQGGTLQQLDQGLYNLGYLGQPQGIAAGDFDGNAQLDLAVVLIDPFSSAVTPQGEMWFYLCLQGEYHGHAAVINDQTEPATPIIKFVQDLDQDGGEEVVASFAGCGAHTCSERFAIFGWQNDQMSNLLTDATEAIPSPQASLAGPDAQGYYALKIVSGGIGSVGAGPQRTRTLVYTYNPQQGVWTFFGSQLGQSDYRLHALHDADGLAEQEKFSEALVIYQQVISSIALQDWQDPETERAYLSSYAQLKMSEIYTLLEQTTLAQAAIAEFEQAAFPGSVGEGYLDVLRVFQRTWNGENLSEACAAVQDYVSSRSEELAAPLGSQQFGYANPEFDPHDFCPWQ